MGGRISQSVKPSQNAAISTAMLVVARWMFFGSISRNGYC
jgi:hypothetical protein